MKYPGLKSQAFSQTGACHLYASDALSGYGAYVLGSHIQAQKGVEPPFVGSEIGAYPLKSFIKIIVNLLKADFKLIPHPVVLCCVKIINYLSYEFPVLVTESRTGFQQPLGYAVHQFISLNLIHHGGGELLVFEFKLRLQPLLT